MARIAGVNIPDNKHTVISLTYIFGIGRTTAQKICAATGVNPAAKIKDLTEEQIEAYVTVVAYHSVVSAPKPTRVPVKAHASRSVSNCIGSR